jgi:uncharacterized protein
VSTRSNHRDPDVSALVATAATIAAHLAVKVVNDKPSVVFIVVACLFWTVFVIVRARQDRSIFAEWGFRADNLLPAIAAAAPLFCIGAVGLALIAAYQGDLHFPLHTLALFLVYPIWGVIQQCLALGIVVSNLERIRGLEKRQLAIIVLSAVLFGLIHIYDWRLAAGTFLFELAAIPLYMRFRNLWPLGVVQGWLGALFYLWVLHEDLWVETFRR